jgi:VWFA-related protein
VRLLRHSVQVAATLGLLFVCGYACAQQESVPDKFTSRSELVLIPVVVRDKSGAPISGLKKDDFLVRENGKERPLTLFEEVATTPAPWREVPKTEAGFSNLVFTPAKPNRVSIVLVDTINTPRLDMALAREALLKFAGQSAERREPVAILGLTRGGVRLLHDFTTDPTVLATALEQVRSQEPAVHQDTADDLEATMRRMQELEVAIAMYPYGAAGDLAASVGELRAEMARIRAAAEFQQDFVDFQRRVAVIETMEGLQQVAGMFARIPGRKSLIWATAGFPFSLSESGSYIPLNTWFSNVGMKDVLPLYGRTWRLLNDANISVYPVDVRGLRMNAPTFDGRYSLSVPGVAASGIMNQARGRADAMEDDTIYTMQSFAEMTGGRAFYDRNDLERCFQQATEDSASYYMLGYYLEKNARRGWHKLDVKLRVARGQVRARSGFYVGEGEYDVIARRGEDFRLALRSPLDYTELGLAVQIVGVSPAGEKRRVNFRISMTPSPRVVDFDGKNHMALEYVAVAMRPDGSTAAELDQRAEGLLKPATADSIASDGLHHNASLELPPGDYTLRVVVRDNLHGLLGSASGPISVR